MLYPYFFSSYSSILCDNQRVIKFVSVLPSLYAITSNLKRISGVILRVKFSVFFVKISPPQPLNYTTFCNAFLYYFNALQCIVLIGECYLSSLIVVIDSRRVSSSKCVYIFIVVVIFVCPTISAIRGIGTLLFANKLIKVWRNE